MPKFAINFLGKFYVTKQFPFFMYHPQFHKLKGFEQREVLDNIKPGDYLIRRNRGWVTAKAIPGYWMHAGLYIGNNKIIHALCSGVTEEDILDFFRTDGIALLRPKIKTEQIKKGIEIAKKLVENNTPYDYSFKDDNGKVYCTELLNICYEGLFNDDYAKDIGGGNSLLPDGAYKSKKSDKLVEFRH